MRVVTVEFRYKCQKTGKLLLGIRQERVLEPRNFVFWGVVGFFDNLSKLQPGQSMSTVLDASFIGKFSNEVPIRVPKIAMESRSCQVPTRITKGMIVMGIGSRALGLISNVDGAWVEILTPADWFRGKSIEVETRVMDSKSVTPDVAEKFIENAVLIT